MSPKFGVVGSTSQTIVCLKPPSCGRCHGHCSAAAEKRLPIRPLGALITSRISVRPKRHSLSVQLCRRQADAVSTFCNYPIPVSPSDQVLCPRFVHSRHRHHRPLSIRPRHDCGHSSRLVRRCRCRRYGNCDGLRNEYCLYRHHGPDGRLSALRLAR